MRKTENELVVLEEVKYPVSADDIQDFLKEYKDVPDIDLDAENAGELYQVVLKGHKRAVKFRTSIEKKRKELKSPALEYGKKVDSIAKEFQAMVNPKEDELYIQRKKVEDNEQRKQDELIAKERERVDTINAKINTIKDLPLKWMNESSDAIKSVIDSMGHPTKEEFEEFIDTAVNTYNVSLQQLESLYDTKVKSENAERIERENEEKRKAEEKALEEERAKEREAFEKEKAEFEQQKKEQERIAREQQDEINRQNAEREAEEFEKQQEQERIARENESKELFESRWNESKDAIELCESNKESILDAIIEGKIPHVKWEG